jgi:hypothetical protein
VGKNRDRNWGISMIVDNGGSGSNGCTRTHNQSGIRQPSSLLTMQPITDLLIEWHDRRQIKIQRWAT